MNQKRNKDEGIPGNGGQFAQSHRAQADAAPLEYIPSKNVEARVAASQAARARIASGKPSWGERIPASAVWRDQTKTWDQKRDAFVGLVKKSKWYQGQEEFSDLRDTIEELEYASDEAEMKYILEDVYDQADVDRINLSYGR